MQPEEIAIVHRSPSAVAELLGPCGSTSTGGWTRHRPAPDGGRARCEGVDRAGGRELDRLFCGPRRGEAMVLACDELDEARALSAGRRALGELGELARTAPELAPGDAAELVGMLAGVEIVSGERANEQGGRGGPARRCARRRVRALFLCGLQEGVFPASARTEPLLGDEQRRRLAETSGLRLGGPRTRWRGAIRVLRRRIAAGGARSCSAGTWRRRRCTGARSLFVDDVVDLFDEGWRSGVRIGPSERWAGLRPAILGLWRAIVSCGDPRPAPAGRHAKPAIEGTARAGEARSRRCTTSGCGMSCATTRGRPRRSRCGRAARSGGWSSGCCARRSLDPDPEPLARGGLAHAVLRDTLEGLSASGPARRA